MILKREFTFDAAHFYPIIMANARNYMDIPIEGPSISKGSPMKRAWSWILLS